MTDDKDAENEVPEYKVQGRWSAKGPPQQIPKIIDYPNAPIDSGMRVSDEELAKLWKRIRAAGIDHSQMDGDEKILYYTGESNVDKMKGFPFLDEKKEGGFKPGRMIAFSTPTGRTTPNYADLFSRRALVKAHNLTRKPLSEDAQRIVNALKDDPVVNSCIDATFDGSMFENADDMSMYDLGVTHGAEAAFRSGYGNKSNMGLHLLRYQIEVMKKAGVHVELPISMDPLYGVEADIDWDAVIGKRFGTSVEADTGTFGKSRFNFNWLDRIAQTVARPHWSFSGDGKVDYHHMKRDYDALAHKSKLAGDERHEQICTTLLQNVKKRRKAYRKLLDFIRSEIDGNHNTESHARNGKNERRASNGKGVPVGQSRGIRNRH